MYLEQRHEEIQRVPCLLKGLDLQLNIRKGNEGFASAFCKSWCNLFVIGFSLYYWSDLDIKSSTV